MTMLFIAGLNRNRLISQPEFISTRIIHYTGTGRAIILRASSRYLSIITARKKLFSLISEKRSCFMME